MRFIKVFLVSLFSLVGGVAAILGVMYLTGSFNKAVVHPEEIHFEQSEFYTCDDFSMTIDSNTLDVTVNEVELSLENQVGGVVNGKISDGVIEIPHKVILGRAFNVQLVKGFNSEIGQDWICGGVSKITAKSESDRILGVSTEVFVDVPVWGIDLVTYTNDSSHTESTTFAKGESFYAEVEFLPASSKYKYSTTDTKRVLFDISTISSQTLEQNDDMTEEMIASGKPYITGYNVKQFASGNTIRAYSFTTAIEEAAYVNAEREEIMRYLKTTSNGKAASVTLEFTNRTVKSFTLDSNAGMTLPFNDVSYIYANNPIVNVPNLGITITGSDNSSLQNKISDVGIRALVRDGGGYRDALDSEITFLDSDNYQIEEVSGVKYYMPTLVLSNIDKSYWPVVVKTDSLQFVLEAYLFENNDTIEQTAQVKHQTPNPWYSGAIINTTMSWTDENAVNLTFVDASEQANKIYPEYDLSQNISLTNVDATYKTVKFLAYSPVDGVRVDSIIQNATATSMYDLTAYGVDKELYEIADNVIKAKKNGTVHVIAVIVKHDYMGRLITIGDTNPVYDVYTVASPTGDVSDTAAPLPIVVTKTIQDISASLCVNDLSTVKNFREANLNVLSQLSFTPSDSKKSFDVSIRVTAGDDTTIEDEIALFVEAWNNDNINIHASGITGNVSSLIFFDQDIVIDKFSGEMIGDSAWEIRIPAYALETNSDTMLFVTVTYDKTPGVSETTMVKSVTFEGEMADYSFSSTMPYAPIEIYDGLTAKLEFNNIETTPENYVKKSETITTAGSSYELGDDTIYIADSVKSTYILGEQDITDALINEDGSYNVQYYDKYDNIIHGVQVTDYNTVKTNTSLTIEMNKFSSSVLPTEKPTATLYIREIAAGNLESIKYNKGLVEEYQFKSDYIDITNSYDENTVIKIDRYAVTGDNDSCIMISGENGLIHMIYRASDTRLFELREVLEYNITTVNWETTYGEYIELVDNYINVKKSIGTAIVLNINVNTHLGFGVKIELKILPNISITPSIMTEQTGASDFVENNITYTGVYSNNYVQFKVDFAMRVLEGFQINATSSAGSISLASGSWQIARGSSASLEFKIMFDASQLGLQTITLSTGSGLLDVAKTIYVNVCPNLTLVGAENNTLTKSLEVSELNKLYSVLEFSEFAPILGTEEISGDQIAVKIATERVGNTERPLVYLVDGDTNTITASIFETDHFKIKATSQLRGVYLVLLDVTYGGYNIGRVEVTISTDMKPNTDEATYNAHFANYNGEESLILTSGTYTFEEILSYFSNVESVDFAYSTYNNPDTRELVFKVSEIAVSKIEVQSIGSYTYLDCLILTSDVGEIKYPVLFSPLDVGYVKYTGDGSAVVNVLNRDFAYLLDEDYIIENNIYDSYSSGKTTSLLQSMGGGLSNVFFEFCNSYTFNLYNEIDGEIDYGSATTFASYDKEAGSLICDSASVDRFVWLVIEKNNEVVAKYRILIVANSSLNVYYPYVIGITPSSDLNNLEYAEYVDATKGDVYIYFDSAMSENLPNSAANAITKRVLLQYGNATEGYETASDYKLVIDIESVSVDGVNIPNIEDATHLIFYNNIDNYVRIKATTKVIVVVVKCSAEIDGDDVGAEVYYKIFANNTALNYALYYLDNTGAVTNTEYTNTRQEVTYGENFDFSDIGLVNVEIVEGIIISKNKIEGLEYYTYLEGDKDVNTYITLDKVSKTLSLKENVSISSDLNAHLVMFTQYGLLADVEVVFKSNISNEFNTSNGAVTLSGETYEVYSDIPFDFNQTFILHDGTTPLAISQTFWLYSLDGGLTYSEDGNVKFLQKDSGLYNIKVKVLLTEYNERYPDDYEFSITLKVLDSIKSNYPQTPYNFNNGVVVYDASAPLVAQDIIFAVGTEFEAGKLFSVYDASVLNAYEAQIQITVGSAYFVSGNEIDFTDWKTTNTLTLNVVSPPQEVLITVAVELVNGTFSLKSQFSFSLIPDLTVEANYPKAHEADAGDNFEAYYLNGTYINGANNAYSWGTNDWANISFDEANTSYFETQRLVVKDNAGVDVSASSIAERSNIIVKSVAGNVVVYYYDTREGVAHFNTDISQSVNCSISEGVKVQWVGTANITTNISASVTFAICIDGQERAEYTIVFYSKISEIFDVKINTILPTLTEDNKAAEIYYVDSADAGAIFSSQQALLEFNIKQTYLSSLGTSSQVWEAFVENTQDNNKVASITIDATSTNVQMYLTANNKSVSLDNLIIRIGENEFVFDKFADNSIYAFIAETSVKLTYRLEATYLGRTLSYDNFAQTIMFGENLNALKAVDQFKVSRSSEQALNNIVTVFITADEQTVAEYYYTLKYDFAFDESKTQDVYAQNINATETIADMLGTFGITRYDGSAFDAKYFADNEKILNAKVLAIGNSNFDSSRNKNDLLYINPDEALDQYNAEIVESTIGVSSNYTGYLLVSPRTAGEDTNIYTYNFRVTAYGANNDGNYVYVLLTYEKNNVNLAPAHVIVKFFVSPIWTPQFQNDKSGLNPNDSGNPYVLNYISGSDQIASVELASNTESKNLISIYMGGDLTTNYAVEGRFKYTIEGDIAQYVQLDQRYKGDGNYYSGKIILTNTDSVANYGSKTGRIVVEDEYGYKISYYLYLAPKMTENIQFADVIVNSIGNISLYEGSTVCLVDDETFSGDFNADYAYRISNLADITLLSGYSYTVSYALNGTPLERVSDNADDAQYSYAKIPVQKPSFYGSADSKSVVMTVVISIYHNGVLQENVTLEIENTIIKRYLVNSSGQAYVREGVAFGLTDYISISDATLNESIGQITLSNTTTTLVIPSSLSGKTLTVTAKDKVTGANTGIVSFVIGTNIDGSTKSPVTDKSNSSAGSYYYYPLIAFETFKDLEFDAYNFTLTHREVETHADFALITQIKDKLLSVVTMNMGESAQTVSVVLNNNFVQTSIEFKLNVDGKQSVSVFEALMKDYGTNSTAMTTSVIDGQLDVTIYELDSRPMSESDLQELKGVTIYNNTLDFEIKAGLASTKIKINAQFDGEQIASKTYTITNNSKHIMHVNLFDLLGEQYNLELSNSYNFEVEYTIRNVQSSEIAKHYNDIVLMNAIAGYVHNPIYSYNEDSTLCTYILKVNNYKAETQQITEEKLKVLSASDFVSKVKSNVNKYYLVKFNKDNVVYNTYVKYNITPVYYGVDKGGNTEGFDYNIICRNQCSYSGGIYTIDYTQWANGYSLINKAGESLQTLSSTEAKNNLVFEIQAIDDTAASGAATFDSNKNIVTTSAFDPEQQYIRVVVKARVNNNPDELVTIGEVNVKIENDSLAVSVAGTYRVTISSPQINNRVSSINADHTFSSTKVKIADMISENVGFNSLLNDEDRLLFNSESSALSFAPEVCSYSVASVVSNVYEVVYSDGSLNAKIGIEQTKSSVNKNVTLVVTAYPKHESNFIKTSKAFDIFVGYDQQGYYVSYDNGSGAVVFRENAGYFNITLNNSDIFDTLFVGSDYTYKLSVKDINDAVAGETRSIIYCKQDIRANIGEELFFELSYMKNDTPQSIIQILGLKNTADNQRYAGTDGYAIDISQFLDASTIANYTLSFVGAYDLDFTDGDEYNLLVTCDRNPQTRVYSLAHIEEYDEEIAYKIDDYGHMMSFLAGLNNSITIYTDSTFTYSSSSGTAIMPKYVFISQDATAEKMNYYAVETNMGSGFDLFGVTSSTNNIILDVEEYANDIKLVVYNASGSVLSDVTQLFNTQTEVTTHWTSIVDTGSPLVAKSKVTKSTSTLTHDDLTASLTWYNFNIAVGKQGMSIMSIELTPNNLAVVDMSAYTGEASANRSYNFKIAYGDTETNLAIDGSLISALDFEKVVKGLTANFDDANYFLTYLPTINNHVTSENVIYYEIKSMLGQLYGYHSIKMTALDTLSGCYSYKQDLLMIGAQSAGSATQITDTQQSIMFNSSNTVQYLTFNNTKSSARTYVALLLVSAQAYNYDISALMGDDDLLLVEVTQSFMGVNPGDSILMRCDRYNYDRTLTITNGISSAQITIPAGITEQVITVPASISGSVVIY